MQITVKLLSIEPRNDGSGQIAIDAEGYAQEVDEKGLVISEQVIPAAHKTILINSDDVIKALSMVDPVKDRAGAEEALFQLALSVAMSDPIFNPEGILERLTANQKSQDVAEMVKQIMGSGSIDVPVGVGQPIPVPIGKKSEGIIVKQK
jgi:hypothetical protein